METKTEGTIVLRIGGMTCTSCRERIEKKIKKHPGD
jgi:copper chaperone CopZ